MAEALAKPLFKLDYLGSGRLPLRLDYRISQKFIARINGRSIYVDVVAATEIEKKICDATSGPKSDNLHLLMVSRTDAEKKTGTFAFVDLRHDKSLEESVREELTKRYSIRKRE